MINTIFKQCLHNRACSSRGVKSHVSTCKQALLYLTGAGIPSSAFPFSASQLTGIPRSTTVSGRRPGGSLSNAASRPLSGTWGPSRVSAQPSPSLKADDSDTSCNDHGWFRFEVEVSRLKEECQECTGPKTKKNKKTNAYTD